MNNQYKQNKITRNYNSENYSNKNKPEILPTLESVTSSEFRNGIAMNDSAFLSNANDENDSVQMNNIDINQN